MPYRERPAKLEAGEIVECPGCHTTVVVLEDLSCPACRCAMLETRDDGMRRLVVSDHQWLPPLCASCGEQTERRHRIDAGRTMDGGLGPVGRAMTLLVLPLLSLLAFRSSRVTIEVSVPLCSTCATRGPIRPEHVNFEHGCMTLLVHHRLRDAVESSQEDEDGEA